MILVQRGRRKHIFAHFCIYGVGFGTEKGVMELPARFALNGCMGDIGDHGHKAS